MNHFCVGFGLFTCLFVKEFVAFLLFHFFPLAM